jgi:hypothetical protein
VAAVRALVTCGALDGAEIGEIKALPNTSRFLGRKAEAEFRVVQAISEAITELPIERRFVFDSDEKSADEKTRINEASGGTAVFLDVRELENCFLHPAAITKRLQGLTRTDEPDEATIAAAVAEHLAKTDDERLFPGGAPAGDPVGAVRAHAVLEELYWEYSKAPYDKTTEAAILAPLVWRHEPDLLAPLINAIRSPIGDEADGRS